MFLATPLSVISFLVIISLGFVGPTDLGEKFLFVRGRASRWFDLEISRDTRTINTLYD